MKYLFFFKIFCKLLLSKKKVVILILLVGGLLGTLYAITQVPCYFAEVTFAVRDKKGAEGGLLSLASQFGFGGLSSGNETIMGHHTAVQLLQSRLIWENTLLATVEVEHKQWRLINFYLHENKKPIIDFPENRNSFTRQQDSLLNVLRLQISNKQFTITDLSKDSDYRILRVESKNEQFAKLLADQLLAEMTLFYIKLKSETISKNLSFLEKSADSMALVYQKSLYYHAQLLDDNFHPAREIISVNEILAEHRLEMDRRAYMDLNSNIVLLKNDLAHQMPVIHILDAPLLPLPYMLLSNEKGFCYGAMFTGSLYLLYLLVITYIESKQRQSRSKP